MSHPTSKQVDDAFEGWQRTPVADRGTLHAFRAGWVARSSVETPAEHDVWCPMGSPSLTCTCAERRPATEPREMSTEPPVFRSGRVCNCREYPRWVEECPKCLFERPVVTPAHRSTEDLQSWPRAAERPLPVHGVLGTVKAITDDRLKSLIMWESNGETSDALIELWERRGSPLEPFGCRVDGARYGIRCQHGTEGCAVHDGADEDGRDFPVEAKARYGYEKLRTRIREMRTALYTYGDYGEAIGGPLLDAIVDAIDELDAAAEPRREVPHIMAAIERAEKATHNHRGELNEFTPLDANGRPVRAHHDGPDDETDYAERDSDK
jgi:hypothetical protein